MAHNFSYMNIFKTYAWDFTALFMIILVSSLFLKFKNQILYYRVVLFGIFMFYYALYVPLYITTIFLIYLCAFQSEFKLRFQKAKIFILMVTWLISLVPGWTTTFCLINAKRYYHFNLANLTMTIFYFEISSISGLTDTHIFKVTPTGIDTVDSCLIETRRFQEDILESIDQSGEFNCRNKG